MKPALRPVTSREIDYAVEQWRDFIELPSAASPTWDTDEWVRDHQGFIIGRVLPVLRPPLFVYRAAVEAYLAGMEESSDGSSVVPDSARYGRIKDWQGVMHDYLFALHHAGRPDAYGHHWTWLEANSAYRRGWVADGQVMRGAVWFTGLTLGSYPVWAGWVRLK